MNDISRGHIAIVAVLAIFLGGVIMLASGAEAVELGLFVGILSAGAGIGTVVTTLFIDMGAPEPEVTE